MEYIFPEIMGREEYRLRCEMLMLSEYQVNKIVPPKTLIDDVPRQQLSKEYLEVHEMD